ncbi:NTP transferase domain-containing protein [Sphingomonas bacterium]|uniref:phosphocholine cytidylyltransferase family protein n=1 Tax=Sphingomonas bacterium TaxID=1895847 RepID=UPI0020C62CD0|nr:NTP transferase domain-containing protein [Sphingomonas bacterium]
MSAGDAAPEAAPVDTAIVLAAGEGSRLRAAAPSKPLCPIGGKPLVDHALERLAMAGIARAIVVVGYLGEQLVAHLASRRWPLAVETVAVDDWTLPNGVSALAGGRIANGPALLVMCDHLVEPALYRAMAQVGPGPGLRLGIDRRLDSDAVDLDDVTCVVTEGTGHIVTIGKGLASYDAFDTGVFAVGPAFFDALAGLDRPSITEGVRALAASGKALVHDIGDLDWIDVDDPPALAMAEDRLLLEAAAAPTGDSERPSHPTRDAFRLRHRGETRMTR